MVGPVLLGFCILLPRPFDKLDLTWGQGHCTKSMCTSFGEVYVLDIDLDLYTQKYQIICMSYVSFIMQIWAIFHTN